MRLHSFWRTKPFVCRVWNYREAEASQLGQMPNDFSENRKNLVMWMYFLLLNCSSAGVLMEKKDDLNALNFRDL